MWRRKKHCDIKLYCIKLYLLDIYLLLLLFFNIIITKRTSFCLGIGLYRESTGGVNYDRVMYNRVKISNTFKGGIVLRL